MCRGKGFKVVLTIVIMSCSYLLITNSKTKLPKDTKPNSYDYEFQNYEKELIIIIEKNKIKKIRSVSNHIKRLRTEFASIKEKLEEYKHTEINHRENVKVDLEYHLEYTRTYIKLAKETLHL